MISNLSNNLWCEVAREGKLDKTSFFIHDKISIERGYDKCCRDRYKISKKVENNTMSCKYPPSKDKYSDKEGEKKYCRDSSRKSKEEDNE